MEPEGPVTPREYSDPQPGDRLEWAGTELTVTHRVMDGVRFLMDGDPHWMSLARWVVDSLELRPRVLTPVA